MRIDLRENRHISVLAALSCCLFGFGSLLWLVLAWMSMEITPDGPDVAAIKVERILSNFPFVLTPLLLPIGLIWLVLISKKTKGDFSESRKAG